jgi:hypothetical protein
MNTASASGLGFPILTPKVRHSVNRYTRFFLTLVGCWLAAGSTLCRAQPGTAVSADSQGLIAVPAASSGLPPRDLAPGVLTTIDPDQNAEDTAIGPTDLDFVAKHPELAWSSPEFEKGGPNFASSSETLLEMGKNVTLRHPVWGIEFSFKPVRTIEVDLPSKSGTLQRKLVWYLVYKLRYIGKDLYPQVEQVESGTGIAKAPLQAYSKHLRFLPRFTFINPQTKNELTSKVLSTVIPAIEERERIGKPLFDEISISRQEIKPSIGDQEFAVWGVATWIDVPPDTDFFFIQVRGLTNAYKLKSDAAGAKTYLRKTLQLHFWRPGDTINQKEDQIRYGVPAFVDPETQAFALKQFGGLEKRLAYLWIYR